MITTADLKAMLSSLARTRMTILFIKQTRPFQEESIKAISKLTLLVVKLQLNMCHTSIIRNKKYFNIFIFIFIVLNIVISRTVTRVPMHFFFAFY